MGLLRRLCEWFLAKTAPKPQRRGIIQGRGDMLDLMERRLDEIENRGLPIAYDPRTGDGYKPWMR